ncbi:hypothetical protein Syn7502_02830 [Synechococcus sp. PCC 7502]|uniref:hypothetical protein n=1 Tax=Synechococcus sp. PCC 7502 TaxID=1173263 RepID=UPI00029FDF09|nr:hypothetical protein [Synechococcus sp. PCC 7502]AFY74767.1 hypothetical protein Syn7502_02830 [Synechococcus sp. PCC 7502]
MNTQKIEQAITSAAFKARQQMWEEYGEMHDLEKLKGTYRNWFDGAVDALIEECMPVVSGSNPHVFNGHSFDNAIAKLKPNYTAEDEADQYIFDQILAA